MNFNSTLKTFIVFIFFCQTAAFLNAQTLKSGFENAVVPAPPPGWVVSHTNNSNWQSLDGNAYNGINCMYLADSYYGDTSDAWLFSPAYTFEAGKKYSISFYYKNQNNQNNALQLTFGSDTLPATQTNILWQNSFVNEDYTKAQINYTATTSGTVYIAFHCITPETYTYLYVDNFEATRAAAFEPLNVAVSNITTNSAKAMWASVDGASKYEYGISDTLRPPSTTFFTTADSAALTSLSTAKQYYFYVRTVLPNGKTSAWSVQSFATSYDQSTFPMLTCGTPFENDFIGGTGIYNTTLCGLQAFGKEFFHKFIPTHSATYNFNAIYTNDGQTVSFAYKDSAAGAGADGWICIGTTSFFGGASYSFGPLDSGKTYYILEKTVRAVPLETSYSYSIDCYAPPPPYDDCENAIEITSGPYNNNCTGTHLTTIGATPGTLQENPNACGSYDGVYNDEIWMKFKATDDVQLFRFNNMVYTNSVDPFANPGLYFNIFSNPCDLNSLVDCGQIFVDPGVQKDIYSYKLRKDSTYYIRIFTADNATYATFDLCIMNPGVANGVANACTDGLPYYIDKNTDNDNTNYWVPLTNKNYKLIGEVNTQGNELNQVTPDIYINNGPLRKDGNGVYYLDRSFTFTSISQPASPIKVRLFISNEELNKLIVQPGSNVSVVSDLRVTQNDDNCASAFTNPAQTFITPSASGDYNSSHKFIEFETDHLSSFYLHGGSSALPVSLLSFTCNQFGNSVKVNWKVAAETSMKNYVVERSSNARIFSQIGIVKASGNDGKQHDYSFADANISAGKYFYRLREISNDGAEKFSNIVAVNFTGMNAIAVSPNPFKDKIIITTNEAAPANYTASITDMNGKIILLKTMQTVAGNNVQTIYLQNVAAGVYTLKLTSSTTVKVVKLIKQ